MYILYLSISIIGGNDNQVKMLFKMDR